MNNNREINGLQITKGKLSEFKEICIKLYDVFKEDAPKEKLNIIWNIVLIILIVSFLKIPFILVRYLGDTLLQYFKIANLYTIWGILIELIYLYFGTSIFMNTFIKYFSTITKRNPKNQNEEKIKIGEELSSVSLTSPEKKIEDK